MHVVDVMHSKFKAGSRCDKGQENIRNLNCHGGCLLQHSLLSWRHGRNCISSWQ